MKTRKHLPFFCGLLLWAALFCFSGYSRAGLFSPSVQSMYRGSPLGKFSAQEQPPADACLEQLASYASVKTADCPLPHLVQPNSLLAYLLNQHTQKQHKVSNGFPSLCGLFRILPNGP